MTHPETIVTTPAVADQPAARDLLAFSPYERAFTRLLLRADPKSPFVAGVFGRWGSGKSTFIMRVMQRLKDKGKTAVLFQPWLFDDREEVWRALIFSVLQYLEGHARRKNRQVPELESLLLGLAEASLDRAMAETAFMRRASVGARDAGAAIRFANTFRQQFKEATSKALAAEGSPQLYIFIDDLDRCSPGACVSTIEAIKLFFDIPGCVFVLGIDRDLVRAGIANKYTDTLGIDGEEYLEKIIQLPFALPPVSERQFFFFARETAAPCGLDEKVVWLLARFSSRNPRRFKRMLNCYLLVRTGAEEMGVDDQVDGSRLAWLLGLRQFAPRTYQRAIAAPDSYLREHDAWFGQGADGSGEEVDLASIARAFGGFFEGFTLQRLFPDVEDLVRHLWLTDLTGSDRDQDRDGQIELDYYKQTLDQWEPPDSPVDAVERQRVDESRERFKRLISEAVGERASVAGVLGWPRRREELDGLAKSLELDLTACKREYEPFFRAVRRTSATLLVVLFLGMLAIIGPDVAQYTWYPLDGSDEELVRADVEAWRTSEVERQQLRAVQQGAKEAVQQWVNKAEELVTTTSSQIHDDFIKKQDDSDQPLSKLPTACDEAIESTEAVVPQTTLDRLELRVKTLVRDRAEAPTEDEGKALRQTLVVLLEPLFHQNTTKYCPELNDELREAHETRESSFNSHVGEYGVHVLLGSRMKAKAADCLTPDEKGEASNACVTALRRLAELPLQYRVGTAIDGRDIMTIDEVRQTVEEGGREIYENLVQEANTRQIKALKQATKSRRAELLRDALVENFLWLLGLLFAAATITRMALTATRALVSSDRSEPGTHAESLAKNTAEGDVESLASQSED